MAGTRPAQQLRLDKAQLAGASHGEGRVHPSRECRVPLAVTLPGSCFPGPLALCVSLVNIEQEPGLLPQSSHTFLGPGLSPVPSAAALLLPNGTCWILSLGSTSR